MFSNTCIYSNSKDASSYPPNNQDLKQVLYMLNSGKFYTRVSPEPPIKSVLEKRWFETEGFPICHAMASRVVDNFPAMKKESGYLIISSMDIDSLTKYMLIPKNHTQVSHFLYPELAFNSTTNQFDVILQHHSVVIDIQGDYIECLPVEPDHLNKYLFVPHQSGALGYNLLAN